MLTKWLVCAEEPRLEPSNPEAAASQTTATPAFASTTADAQPVGSIEAEAEAEAEAGSAPAQGVELEAISTWQDPLKRSAAFQQLDELMQQRILIIDGAMGTAIQRYKLSEEDYRGHHYKQHGHELKGNNDILVVSKPEVIEEIHLAYLEAGADIIETNTFSGTSIAQADYELDSLEEVHLINTAAAQLAKTCTAKYMADHPGTVKFVAGAVGPTNKTLSVSPSVENPAFRGITYDVVEQAYYEQVSAAICY